MLTNVMLSNKEYPWKIISHYQASFTQDYALNNVMHELSFIHLNKFHTES